MNATRGVLVADSVHLARDPWSRFWGLMGKPGLPKGHGLWLEPCCDIHSFFMRFAFDALFLDKTGKVLYVLEGMIPWRASRFVRGGRSVLELPAGAIAETSTVVGDILILEQVHPHSGSTPSSLS